MWDSVPIEIVGGTICTESGALVLNREDHGGHTPGPHALGCSEGTEVSDSSGCGTAAATSPAVSGLRLRERETATPSRHSVPPTRVSQLGTSPRNSHDMSTTSAGTT